MCQSHHASAGISTIQGSGVSVLIVWKIKLKAAFDTYEVQVLEWQLAGAGLRD